VPWLAPVMLALRDLGDYTDAELVRKKIEACVVAFVTQPQGQDGSQLGFPATDPLSKNPVETFQPGMTAYLKPGESVLFNNPHAVGGYREYKTTELEEIAAGLGLPYELMTGDLSKVNYSSWRGGQLGFRNTVENYRWLTLIPSFCMPVRRRFIDTLILMGQIPTEAADDPKLNLYATQWTAPRFESVDPVKDAEAALKDIRMGRKTWFEVVLENGFDPREQMSQIQRFNKLVDKLEIILDCDPRNVTLRGQEQPAGTEERTPSSKASPGAKGTQGLDGLNAEDLGMIGELVASNSRQANRMWEQPSRTYLT
jgi:lambda family phage portal protein